MKKALTISLTVLLVGIGLVIISCGGGGGGSSSPPAWVHPADANDYISFITSRVEGAQVVMNSGGDAILVWGQSDTNFGSTINYVRVYMSERDGATGTWTHPADINDYISPDGLNCGGGSCFPTSAIDDSGNAIVAWSQNSQAYTAWIFISERDGATGNWTHPSNMNDYLTTITGLNSPSAAIGGGGDAIIAWSEAATLNTSLVYFTQRHGVAGTWSVPEDVFVDIPASPVITGVSGAAINDSGDAILMWLESSSGGSDTRAGWIFVSERDGASDVWTHPTVASDSIAVAGSGASDPRLAMAGNGEAIISWFENDGTDYQVYIAERDGTTGGWTWPADLTDKLSPSGSRAWFNRPAVNSGGEAVVIWRQLDNMGDEQIFMSERDGTGLWDNPVDLSDNISPDGFSVAEREVDIDDDGHAVIAWKQKVSASGTEALFFIERESSSAAWVFGTGIDDYISPVDGRWVSPPSLAVGGNGNAIVVWRQGDGYFTNERLYMSEKR